MKKISILILLLTSAGILLLNSCKKEKLVIDKQELPTLHPHAKTWSHVAARAAYSGFPETMETGSKTAYAAADVTLGTGSWNFNDALLGNLSSDRKNGLKSARIQNLGMLTMNFNVTSGAYQVSVAHAIFGTDAASTWALYVSTNSGSTWAQEGSSVTTNTTTLTTTTFTMNYNGNVRFQIRKLSGGRLNIDDINIIDNIVVSYPDDDNYLTMGNPSNAVVDVNFPNNYLLVKSQYALAYNNARGGAGWVSWHLTASDMGTTPRCDCFTADAQLPTGFFKATTSNYTNTGFDRGHQCPSADRNNNATNNAATFLMTNMLPQSPNLNQITWEAMETYERTLVSQGNEVYIISGGYGNGATGSNGGVTNTINNGTIAVPNRFWKVILVLPNGNGDVNRVTSSTRVIAVDMPNNQTVNSQSWGTYRTTVDAIESATGYNILSNIPASTQNIIEAVVDNGPTQ